MSRALNHNTFVALVVLAGLAALLLLSGGGGGGGGDGGGGTEGGQSRSEELSQDAGLASDAIKTLKAFI